MNNANTMPRDRRRDWCNSYERVIQGKSIEDAQKLVDEEWFWQYCRGSADFAKQLDHYGRPVVIERDGKLVIELEERDGKS